MLDLDSPRWGKLSHAHGSASDIPDLLRAITKIQYSGDSRGPWLQLYGSLCHQFTLGTAAYAAFPHLIGFAEAACGKPRLEYLNLASCIEAERHMPYQPAFPRGLKEAYMQAFGRASVLAEALLSQRWDDQDMRCLLGMIAIFRGNPKLGFSMQGSTDQIECMECGHIQSPPYYEEFGR